MGDEYDLIIIGSGPAGYSAAIRAAKYSKKVLIIEKNVFGGECLNYACIPFKTLIHYVLYLNHVRNLFKKGVFNGEISINIDKLREIKDNVVNRLRDSLLTIFKRLDIKIIYGEAIDIKGHDIYVNTGDGVKIFSGKYILLALGSIPYSLKNISFDGKYIISSRDAISLNTIPEKLCIIGGGPIGVEVATLYSLLGSKVTIFEMMDRLLPTLDRDIGRRLSRGLRKLGINIYLKSKVTGLTRSDGKIYLNVDINGANEKFTFNKVLISIGRRPNTKYKFIEDMGIKLDADGCIRVDDSQKTNIDYIYAAGDIAGKPFLAHKAYFEGLNAVESMFGEGSLHRPKYIPITVFSYPEVYSIGVSEDDIEDEEVDVIKAPITLSGKAYAEGLEGLIKIILSKIDKKIIGLHIIGDLASTLSPVPSIFIENDLSYRYIIDTVFPHPTYGEALWEIISSIENKSIHFHRDI